MILSTSLPRISAQCTSHLLHVVVCLVLLALVSGAALAADDQRSEIEDLRRRVEELERRLTVRDEKAFPILAGYDGKFYLKSEDGDYRMNLGGRIQFDGRFPLDGPSEDQDELLLRRIRTYVSGRLARYYEFKVEYDFAKGEGELKSAYLNFAHVKQAELKVGHFTVPFSVEELTSSKYLPFVECSIINRFAPDIQIGAALHGRIGRFNYEAGVFDGEADGHFLYAARVGMPLARKDGPSILRGWSVGLNAARQHNEGVDLHNVSYKTDLQTRFFRYDEGVISDGSKTLYGADASYWGGPLGFVAEYIVSEQDARNAGGTTHTITNKGWYVQASYLLTGEKASATGVKPNNNFDPFRGGWGAFELAGRYAKLKLDGHVADFASTASDATVVTTGVNWYLNKHVKVMLDYVHSEFSGTVGNDDREHGIMFRVQLVF